MNQLLWRSSGRYLLRHPWLMGLSVLGVALGVAVVVSIDLANTSARQAFALSAETVTGKATHQVAGTSEGLPEAVYRTLRVDLGIERAAPVVEGYAVAPRYEGRTFHLLGLDPFAEAPFRPYLEDRAGLDLSAFLAGGSTGLLSRPTAEAGGLAPGDTLRVKVGGIEQEIRIIGFLEPEDERSARAMEHLIVVDIATAQELLGLVDRLSRIDLLVPEGAAGDRLLARIRAALPEGVDVVRSSSRTETVEQMTRAFNLNLTALSLLALIVGMFLIYSTMTFSVVQRRPLVGQLRALGVTRREVGALVLGEAVAVGLVGTLLGLLLGIVLGRGLVHLVTQTINDLYYVVTVRTLTLSPLTLLKGFGLGLGATLLATLAPAREATRTTVSTVLRRSHTESRIRSRLPALAVLGLALGAAGAGLLRLAGRDLALSYLGLLLVLLAFALLVPAAVVLLARLARPVMGRLFGILGRMSARGVTATLSRTAVAIAALMIALAATIGIGVMVSSFRQTVVAWLDYSLQADVYVQPPSLVFRRADATLDPALVERLKRTPGVAAAYSVRSVQVSARQGRTELVVIDTGSENRRTFRFTGGDPERTWTAFQEAGAVLISEPYSYRYRLGAGDTLHLQTDRGEVAFPVAGVFYDYGSDTGVVMMARHTYERYYDDRGISGLALDAAPGQSVDALVERLHDRAGAAQEVFIRSNRALRETSMEVFDRTFTITAVLRLLAVLVAFIGVLSALMALQLEKGREFAVLRANGMTPRQVWHYVTMQTGLMGLIAGLLSVPLGLVLAWVLIYVINKRSFGWTLQFEVPPEILLQALLLGLAAAVLAGLYPSRKMARANPAEALREE